MSHCIHNCRYTPTVIISQNAVWYGKESVYTDTKYQQVVNGLHLDT